MLAPVAPGAYEFRYFLNDHFFEPFALADRCQFVRAPLASRAPITATVISKRRRFDWRPRVCPRRRAGCAYQLNGVSGTIENSRTGVQ